MTVPTYVIHLCVSATSVNSNRILAVFIHERFKCRTNSLGQHTLSSFLCSTMTYITYIYMCTFIPYIPRIPHQVGTFILSFPFLIYISTTTQRFSLSLLFDLNIDISSNVSYIQSLWLCVCVFERICKIFHQLVPVTNMWLHFSESLSALLVVVFLGFVPFPLCYAFCSTSETIIVGICMCVRISAAQIVAAVSAMK